MDKSTFDQMSNYALFSPISEVPISDSVLYRWSRISELCEEKINRYDIPLPLFIQNVHHVAYNSQKFCIWFSVIAFRTFGYCSAYTPRSVHMYPIPPNHGSKFWELGLGFRNNHSKNFKYEHYIQYYTKPMKFVIIHTPTVTLCTLK